MLRDSHAFSGYSVDEIAKVKSFYAETLGLDVEESEMGLEHKLDDGNNVFIYAKGEAHTPASFTILNFPVENIDEAVDQLSAKGVVIERYGEDMHQDEKGIARGRAANMGPDIAWFKDPAGNVLSVLH